MIQTGYQYKLLSVTMNDGTVLRPDKLTVLVGPNNSGKSRALKEIATFTTHVSPPPRVVLGAIEVNYPSTLAELRMAYNVERNQDQDGTWVIRQLDIELGKEHTAIAGSWPSV